MLEDLMKRFRRHRCAPTVKLAVLVNGHLIAGPLTTEDLAYIARYSGIGGKIDLLGEIMPSGARRVQVIAEYQESSR